MKRRIAFLLVLSLFMTLLLVSSANAGWFEDNVKNNKYLEEIGKTLNDIQSYFTSGKLDGGGVAEALFRGAFGVLIFAIFYFAGAFIQEHRLRVGIAGMLALVAALAVPFSVFMTTVAAMGIFSVLLVPGIPGLYLAYVTYEIEAKNVGYYILKVLAMLGASFLLVSTGIAMYSFDKLWEGAAAVQGAWILSWIAWIFKYGGWTFFGVYGVAYVVIIGAIGLAGKEGVRAGVQPRFLTSMLRGIGNRATRVERITENDDEQIDEIFGELGELEALTEGINKNDPQWDYLKDKLDGLKSRLGQVRTDFEKRVSNIDTDLYSRAKAIGDEELVEETESAKVELDYITRGLKSAEERIIQKMLDLFIGAEPITDKDVKNYNMYKKYAKDAHTFIKSHLKKVFALEKKIMLGISQKRSEK